MIGDDGTQDDLAAALDQGPRIYDRAELEELAELAYHEPDGELTANQQPNPERLSVILYTSGTTGRPKASRGPTALSTPPPSLTSSRPSSVPAR